MLALLWSKRKEVGVALLLATALTGFIDMAPTQYLPSQFPWTRLRIMPTWLDEQYMWMSVATLGAIAWILYEFGFVVRTQAALMPHALSSLADAGASAAPRTEKAAKSEAKSEKKTDKKTEKKTEKAADARAAGRRRPANRNRSRR